MPFYYNDDIDEEYDDEEYDDDEYDEDDEDDEDGDDDGEGDGYGDDTGDGYGDDLPNPDEEALKELQEQEEQEELEEQEKKEKEEKKKKEKQEKESKGSGKGKKLGKNDPAHPKNLVREAKRYGFPTIRLPYVCPICKKMTLFPDKYAPMFIRGVLACYPGIVPKDKVFMCVCLNRKCKSFWPTWGVKYSISEGKLVKNRNIFHIVR